MKISELYKIHINPDADILELYQFYDKFDLNDNKIQIKNPNPDIEKLNQLHEIEKEHIARCWILKNTKLTEI